MLGMIPKIIPVNMDDAIVPHTVSCVMIGLIGENLANKRHTRALKVKPTREPKKAIPILSMRNCLKIDRLGAPMAFLIPISEVLSPTLRSITFIIPIPPTNSAIPVSPIKSHWRMLVNL